MYSKYFRPHRSRVSHSGYKYTHTLTGNDNQLTFMIGGTDMYLDLNSVELRIVLDLALEGPEPVPEAGRPANNMALVNFAAGVLFRQVCDN